MYFKGLGRSGPSTLRDFFNIFPGSVPRRLQGPLFLTFSHFDCPKGDTWHPKWLQSGPKSCQNESEIDKFSMSGARGYPQVPKGYPPATPNLQNIDKNHKIHSKYTSQHKTNNVQHISKKKIQNGTAGCFWTLENIYISIVGKSSTSKPPSL